MITIRVYKKRQSHYDPAFLQLLISLILEIHPKPPESECRSTNEKKSRAYRFGDDRNMHLIPLSTFKN